MNELNYRSPLYIQLREVIRSKIEDGEYLPGTAIPSENQLAETYGLNRLSVRSAVEALENEGLLKSVQGKGVFVQGPKTQRDLETLGGYRHTMQERGKDASTKVLVKAVRSAGPLYARLLQLAPEDPVPGWKTSTPLSSLFMTLSSGTGFTSVSVIRHFALPGWNLQWPG